MHIVVHDSISEIKPQQWNSLLPSNNPFMRHEFLSGLEQSGCVCPAKGWQPAHIAAYSDKLQSKLIGAMPCYIKNHSYGEYIFDWAWADAHQRHGINYYPKLCNAVPFTPATGERYLVAKNESQEHTADALITKALSLVEQGDLSSFHSLFLNSLQYQQMGNKGLCQRLSTQFHWQNQGYRHFDDFLARMSSKKRKNIKRERRRIKESNIEYRWLSGEQLDPAAVAQMYQFYQSTIQLYGAQSYLNRAFFDFIAESFSQQSYFLFAYFQDQVIAGGLYFCSDDTLYGRYWGAINNFHSVHFETCYYQAIDWCIDNGYQRFEAGAQGQHKLARGLEPTSTYSCHWISDPRFRHAIEDYVQQEQQQIGDYSVALQLHSPFKRTQ